MLFLTKLLGNNFDDVDSYERNYAIAQELNAAKQIVNNWILDTEEEPLLEISVKEIFPNLVFSEDNTVEACYGYDEETSKYKVTFDRIGIFNGIIAN